MGKMSRCVLFNRYCGGWFEMHEFLFASKSDCNLLGRDLVAKVGIQINIIKGNREANAVVTSH